MSLSPTGETWEEYFRKYRVAQDAKDGILAPGVEAEDEEAPFEVVFTGRPLPFQLLPQTPRGIAARLVRKGFEVHAQISQTAHSDIVFAKTTEGHNAGDVKTPAHLREHYGLAAVFVHERMLVARLRAFWEARQSKPSFAGAHTYDVVQKEEIFHKTATPFSDWLEVFAPKPPPKTPSKKRAPKPTPEEMEAGYLAGEEWSAA